jgi:hypothetical protein
MVMVIYKYPLKVTDYQTVVMPGGATILAAQVQDGRLCLWAMVDPHQPDVERRIRIVGTGNPFEDSDRCRYIGTAQDGPLVWHVFERDTPAGPPRRGG